MVAQAGINRKTFTAHYDSVDTLMRDCIEELIQKLLIHFDPHQTGVLNDFAYSTREYTRFALDNREHLQLVFANQLDSIALHMWKKYLITTQPYTQKSSLRNDLYRNYSMYCCWGNLLWVLEHADLPLDTLVNEAWDVYRIFALNQTQLYEAPEYGSHSPHPAPCKEFSS